MNDEIKVGKTLMEVFADEDALPVSPFGQDKADDSFPGVIGADLGERGLKSPPSAITWRSSNEHIKTGRKPPGRPSTVEKVAMEKARKKELARNPPKPPAVKSWGGRRSGSGRKKRVGPPDKKLVMIRMNRALAEKLEVLPQGEKSEYLRQAIELMSDIQPPEKFLASGRKKKEANGSL